MPMYNLIEYSDNYAKTSGSLWQYFRNEPDNNNIEDSKSFKTKIKITGKTLNNNNEKDVEIMVPLKYVSNFWRTLEMPLINFEVNLILTYSSTCVITNSNGAGAFAITDTKLYVPAVTLSTQENTKFLQQLKSGLTNRQVANIRKAFAKNTSIDIKLSKTQLSKMIQSGGFLGNILGKLAGPLMKVAMPLAKNVLAPLGLSAAMSAIAGSIKKKMLGSGATTLII